jgi:hypothetical protein
MEALIVKKIRKDMRIPVVIMDKVKEYKDKNGLPDLTAAFLELVRKGLESEEQNRK